jgi:predicted metal-binding protein
MTARLIVCTTCRYSEEDGAEATEGSAGQALRDLVAAVMERDDSGDLRLESQACLWACASRCTIYLSAEGKPGYLAGRFMPDLADAEAIVDFARLYAASPRGAVAYRDWPEGMKGRFIARLPS